MAPLLSCGDQSSTTYRRSPSSGERARISGFCSRFVRLAMVLAGGNDHTHARPEKERLEDMLMLPEGGRQSPMDRR